MYKIWFHRYPVYQKEYDDEALVDDIAYFKRPENTIFIREVFHSHHAVGIGDSFNNGTVFWSQIWEKINKVSRDI